MHVVLEVNMYVCMYALYVLYVCMHYICMCYVFLCVCLARTHAMCGLRRPHACAAQMLPNLTPMCVCIALCMYASCMYALYMYALYMYALYMYG